VNYPFKEAHITALSQSSWYACLEKCYQVISQWRKWMGYWRPKPNCFYLISETKKRSAYLQTGGKYVVCVSVGLCFPICMGRDDSKKRERDREREGGYYNATRQGQGMRRLTTVCNNPYSHTPDQGWRGGE